ncbi:TonB-linked outer membrane protein, SusC/RagA family [Pustulibacterium marinum]|uniref:TonB-linked outer membrane protein, SusC/RagA family n=1 Tax=Pustulibacterium marinum TaxID=1224947 RepID=A0A1I7GFB8_9FLAO|nr:SusC/RagA family TonB-linked outer membrane protein [Pustulibacterium marinum]SFU46966.1 TonB-linked outer membrane protein, SusC/RagA family [Pustulibacterium marinum]
MKTKLQIFVEYVCIGIFFCLFTHHSFANTVTEKQMPEELITLAVQNKNITAVFELVENQTNYTFVFDDAIATGNKLCSITVQNATIESVLNQLASQVHVTFNVINNTITVVSTSEETQLEIEGRVIDEQGVPMPGATVAIKDTKTGTSTDFDGNFKLQVATQKVTLVVSYVGYQNVEVAAVVGTFQEITMLPSAQALNEVVVTALGIKREEKKLGYAQATIGAENLSQTNPVNWSSGLKGKVAGMSIVSSGSGPINSQQIVLRGYSSFDLQQNYALVVVDGVPVNTEMTTSGSSSAYMGDDSPVDYGNGISDLNLDDIEEITVLKGPNAAALYGSRGQNGVIMITTKSGKQHKGLGVTINSSANFDVIQRWPEYQYRYGQGTGAVDANGAPYYSYGASEDGSNTGGTSSAWGPAFDGQYFYQYDPVVGGQSEERQLWRGYDDNRKDFWRTGVTIQNNVSLQGGDDKGSMRASFGHSKNEWIMPNTGFERITAAVNAKYQISDRITLGSVVNYNNRGSDNLPSTGYNNGSIAYFMIFQNPNVNLDWYRPMWEEGQENLQQIQPFSSYIDNPFVIANESLNALESSQIVGNMYADIQLTSEVKVLLRSSLNTYNQLRELKRPFSINRYARGFYQKQQVFKEEINTDFLVTYDKELSTNFALALNVGGNHRTEHRRQQTSSVDGLVIPGVYKLSNGINAATTRSADSDKIVSSLYGLSTFSFKDQVFLDVSARNDWSSTLPKSNRSYFYPSANVSAIVSDIFQFKSDAFKYLKYRFSYAKVGNDTDPYQTRKYYDLSSFASSAVVDNTLYNTNLKPETSNSFETGIEARLLNNRINLDVSLYRVTTDNQIITLPLNWSTGYSTKYANAGKIRNQGIELTLGAKIINNDKFKWAATVNWTKNEGEVFELPDEVDNQFIIDTGGSASMIAKVGGSPTAIYGYGFVRSPEGEIVYDSSGLPAYPDSGDIQYIGDATPDWRAGLTNEFQWGNFRFSVTIDGQYGGIIYSQTHHKLTQQGKLTHTYMGRESMTIVGDGVVLNDDGTYSPNTTEVATPAWYNRFYRRANVESNSFDASYLKLREISVQYTLPKRFLKNTFVKSLNVSVYGRNLAVVSDFPIYDPETAALNGNKLMPGVEMGQMPSPASYGVNVKLNL